MRPTSQHLKYTSDNVSTLLKSNVVVHFISVYLHGIVLASTLGWALMSIISPTSWVVLCKTLEDCP